MTCEELRGDYETWALGVIEEPERGELRAHLERGCELCVPGVRSAMEFVTTLSSAVKMVEPPARLRKRVISLVAPEKPAFPWSWLWAAAAAALLMVSGYLGSSRTQQSARSNQILEIMSDPASRQVAFGPNSPKPQGRVFVHSTKGVLLLVAHLPVLPADKTFEMWIIPKAGAPVPAGIFAAHPDNSANYLKPGPVDTSQLGAVAVSIENTGGVQHPTVDQIIFAAPIV